MLQRILVEDQLEAHYASFLLRWFKLAERMGPSELEGRVLALEAELGKQPGEECERELVPAGEGERRGHLRVLSGHADRGHHDGARCGHSPRR